MKLSDEKFEPYVVPDVFGDYLIAWRAWQVRMEGGIPILSSVNQGYDWPPREALVGECKAAEGEDPKHPASETPKDGCGCGIHALSTPLALAKAGYVSMIGPGKTNYIWGPIGMWGRVIQGSSGIKSQYAYPLELYIRKDLTLTHVKEDGEKVVLDTALTRDVLEQTYGVPVTIITHVYRPDKNTDELRLIPLDPEQE